MSSPLRPRRCCFGGGAETNARVYSHKKSKENTLTFALVLRRNTCTAQLVFDFCASYFSFYDFIPLLQSLHFHLLTLIQTLLIYVQFSALQSVMSLNSWLISSPWSLLPGARLSYIQSLNFICNYCCGN